MGDGSSGEQPKVNSSKSLQKNAFFTQNLCNSQHSIAFKMPPEGLLAFDNQPRSRGLIGDSIYKISTCSSVSLQQAAQETNSTK